MKPNPFKTTADGVRVTTPSGVEFIIDEVDWRLLKHQKWYARRRGDKHYITNASGQYLHRIITNVADGVEIDHRNCNPLDNRRANLRESTKAGNQRNKKVQRNSTTGIAGVVWYKARNVWRSRIKYRGREIHVAYHKSRTEAVQARNIAVEILFGEFGRQQKAPPPSLDLATRITERMLAFKQNA